VGRDGEEREGLGCGKGRGDSMHPLLKIACYATAVLWW